MLLLLMKVTMRSLPLTQLIYQMVRQQQVATSNGLWSGLSQSQFSSYQQFLISVRRYIDHYPKWRNAEEEKLIGWIDAIIA